MIKKLLGSRKFVLTFAGCIVAILGVKNVIIPQEAVINILSILGVLIGAIGLEDIGKSSKNND